MPESRKRKKPVYVAPERRPAPKGPSPVWLAPLMLALFVLGIAWLVVFYVAEQQMPLTGHLGNANLLIGFGFIILGFLLSTQWR
ncbi:MAG: cell division protein CrgA [Actinomycetota bacterium]|nr:cell division protein CrgA [Actinomycetota bacterium]